MNGFRQELLSRILGLNGDLGVYSRARGLMPNYDAIAARIRRIPGVISATPIVEGQALLTSETAPRSAAFIRGIAGGSQGLPSVADHLVAGQPRAISAATMR